MVSTIGRSRGRGGRFSGEGSRRTSAVLGILGAGIASALAIVWLDGEPREVVLAVAVGAGDRSTPPAAEDRARVPDIERNRDARTETPEPRFERELSSTCTSAEPAGDWAFSGRLVDAKDRPVAGALVSWTVLPDELELWLHERVGLVRSSSVEVETDADGWFAFEDPPGAFGARGSVVWATHAEHTALPILLAQDEATWKTAEEHVLARAAPLTVTVLDAGEPAPGAVVRLRGLAVDGVPRFAAWMLVRDVATDETGRAALFPVAGEVALAAEARGRRSAPWQGRAGGDLALALRGSFRLSGSIDRALGIEYPNVGKLWVVVSAEVDGQRLEVARIDARADGFGPVELPTFPADPWLVRLDGEGIVIEERVLEPPAPGGEAFVDFEIRPGNLLWLFVSDPDGEPVPDSVATLRWSDGEREIVKEMWPRADGYLPIACLPEGELAPVVTAPGYAAVSLAPIVVPEADPRTWVVTLWRSARLQGVCLSDGEPLGGARIVAWPAHDTDATVRATAHSDGSFELDAPLGRTTVVAFAEGIGTSEPVPVDVRSDTLANVVVELTGNASASGVVVDEATREPLAGALVQQFLSGDDAPFEPLGAPVSTRADGTFTIEGLRLGRVCLRVELAGRSPSTLHVGCERGEEADLGVIALAPEGEVTVRLLHGGDLDPAALSLWTFGPVVYPVVRFDGEGVARLAPACAGRHDFSIQFDEGSSVSTVAELGAERDWSVSIDLTTPNRVSLRVVSDAPLSSGTAVHLLASAGGRWLGMAEPLDSSGSVVFEHVPVGKVELKVVGTAKEQFAVLARDTFEVGLGEHRFELVLGAGDRWVRVVDGAGDPLSGVGVWAFLAGGNGWCEADEATDRDGRCRLPGVGEQRMKLYLSHATHGHRLGFDVPALVGEEALEVELVADAALRFRVTDERGGVPGLKPKLWSHDELFEIAGAYTDAEGRIAWENLAPGDYVLGVEHADFWPVRWPAHASAEPFEIGVSTRRLTTLEIRATKGGLPFQGQVGLRYRDSDSDVAEFVRHGRIDSSTGSLTTDARGELVLERAPEGGYAWTVATEDGAWTGSILHLWSEEEVVRIDLP